MKRFVRPLAALFLSSALAAPVLAQQLHHGASAYSPDLYATTATEGNFSRMFPLDRWGLNPHPSPRYDLLRLGGAGGPMDEGANSEEIGDSQIEAGITFLGQFIDHDITLDLTSSLDERAVPGQTENFRTPDLDLDCVYGDGPEGTPWLYNPKTRLLVKGNDLGNGRFDLARSPANVALIGDPRNDENFILAQIQTAFIAFHNKIAQGMREEKAAVLGVDLANPQAGDAAKIAQINAEAFEEARDDVIHYYHRMIIEYFLPKVIGVTRTVDMGTHGRRFFMPELRANKEGELLLSRPEMPVEFSAAAFRFGHSQVRQTYTLHKGGAAQDLFRAAMMAAPSTPGGETPQQVSGFGALTADRLIDYAMFFPMSQRTDGADKYQPTRKLDPRLPSILFRLSEVNVTPANGLGELAARNLLRGRSFRLPAGEDLFRIVAGGGEVSLPQSLPTGVTEQLLLSLDKGDKADLFANLPVPVSTEAANDMFVAQSSLQKAGVTDAETLDLMSEELEIFAKAAPEIRETLVLEKSPLWYYILHEAAHWEVGMVPTANSHHVWPTETLLQESVNYLPELSEDPAYRAAWGLEEIRHTGQILGPVGGTIVGEVIMGLVDHYREKTNKGLDYRPHTKAEAFGMTEYFGFGPRMTFGDMIQFVGWHEARMPPA